MRIDYDKKICYHIYSSKILFLKGEVNIMKLYRVIDYSEFLVVGKTDDLSIARKMVKDFIYDTDGECAICIEAYNGDTYIFFE